MHYIGKKFVLGCLAGTLAVTGLTGCSSKLDGTSIVATVNGVDIPLGVVSFMTRYQQAQTQQMYEMYFGGADAGMWDQVTDEDTGETYGESARSDVLEQVEKLYLLMENAKDYDVEITEGEQKKITEAAQAFMEANTEETLADLGVSQSDIEAALEIQTYESKMFDPIVADVDTEVSDDEAQQTSVTYVEVTAEEEDADAEDADVTASENEGEGEEEATPEEKAQQILDEVLATADADMDAIAKDVDEDLSATETHFTANPPEKEEDEEEDYGEVPQAVQDVVKDLADGEVAGELVEEDGSYYVVRLEKAFDEEATEDEKESIVSQRKQDMYDDTVDGWKKDADIQEDKKVLKTLKVTSNLKFTFKPEEEADEDASEVSENENGDGEEAAEETPEEPEEEAAEDASEVSENENGDGEEAAEETPKEETPGDEDKAEADTSEGSEEAAE